MADDASRAIEKAGAEAAAAHMLLVDLHSHSRYSDGTASLVDIEDAARRRHIGVALTDHNEIRGAVTLRERDRVATIPAIEVGTKEGLEFLVYFRDPAELEDYYVRWVEPYLLTRFMVRSNVKSLAAVEGARDLGGYISLAHPFAPGRKSIDAHRRKGPRGARFVEDVLTQVDAIELFNGGVLRRSNLRAEGFSVDIEKPFTAGSDSHHISSLGSCGVRFECSECPCGKDLFDKLARNGGHEVVTLQGGHFRTVPIIAMRHTLFFMRGRRSSTRAIDRVEQKRLEAQGLINRPE